MAGLSIEDKGKGKRIVTQFFRTMPGVQKSLMTIFERDGYDGISRIQNLLYSKNSSQINSIDTLRKGLSMILQHIYGMPIEDKEGYFQEVLKCKTASQLIRKEKETLINHFYDDLPALKKYLLEELLEDKNYRVMNILCQNFVGEAAEQVTDMRNFKNQIRTLREIFGDRIEAGNSEDSLITSIKEQKEEAESQRQSQLVSVAETNRQQTASEASGNGATEKKQIILNTLNDAKYHDIRELLLQKVLVDPNFTIFQQYLDNILAPSSRLITKDMPTFSEGVKKIKEFRDNLEKELLSDAT